MKAIRFNATVARYAAGLAMGKLSPSFLWSGASCTSFDEVDQPRLPADDWVRVRTRYGGICGSDLGTIYLHSSPYLEPLTSFPYTFGHESLGTIGETGPAAADFEPGERVVVEPLLGCTARGIQPVCRFCERGLVGLCERTNEGNLAPGLSIGFCKDTGGSWSDTFVAHQSQIYRVPGGISDENALMVEPCSTAVHAALQNLPRDDETVLILGAGTIGLCVLAALRALGSKADILVVCRYDFQAEAAKKLGASAVLSSAKGHDLYAGVAAATNAKLFTPMVGKSILVGGADRIFECVGTHSAIDDALRFVRGGGRVVLVGMPGMAKLDLTSVFVKEAEVRASFCYSRREEWAGRNWSTFELTLDLMKRGLLDLGWMVTHKFALRDYKKAFELLRHKGKHSVIKAAFTFDH
ncbi:MAG TPA: zinc-binding dehydrogenase [Myxococcota bacterium]|nr:zinc-binding dehydrogenase [Myxococcota bacterium]